MLVKKTPDNGLVTDALKLKRKAIEQKYKDDIQQLFQGKSEKDDKSNKKKENPTEVGEDTVSSSDENKKDQ